MRGAQNHADEPANEAYVPWKAPHNYEANVLFMIIEKQSEYGQTQT